MNWLRQTAVLLLKDLRIEWRGKEVLTAMIMFAFIVITVFAVVFDPVLTKFEKVIPGILWTALFFAGNLGMNRAFVREMENDALSGLLVCPVPRSAVYTAKLINQVILMLIAAVIVLPVLVVFFDMRMPLQPEIFISILFLGSAGFSAVGTLLATMALKTRARDMMLPVLLFPVTVPVILASVKGTSLAMYSASDNAALPWLRILVGFDVIMITACLMLYDHVIDD